MKIKFLATLAFAMALGHQACYADILIGQTAGFTGTAATSVNETTLGAKLIIEDVNEHGGVRGEAIKLLSLDDEFDVAKAATNAKTLIEDKKVLALFLNRGTPHTEAIAPLLAQHGVPLIAPSTGAIALQDGTRREIFPVRPSYQGEAAAMVSQLHSMGVRRIVCIHVADAFGKDAMAGVKKRLAELQWDDVVIVPFDRESEDVTKGVEAATRMVDGKYPAVLVVGSSRATSTVIVRIREAGSKAYIAALSTVASGRFIRDLGKHSDFVMVSQVFPKETGTQVPVVRKVTQLLRARGRKESVTPAMLEGAVAAELLVEALKRCAAPCSSKSLMSTLESGKPFSVGWPDHDLVYTPKSRTSIKYAETSIIVDGKYRR